MPIVYLDLQTIDPRGLFRTSEKGRHSLVQWCHGNTGFVLLLCRASAVLNDSSLLSVAEHASEVLWRCGLLYKGTGLCHGTSGNAYAFLELYNATRKAEHLYRALQFAHACLSGPFRRSMRTPDAPYSLYEGEGGLACLLADLLNPDEASFPAFA